MTKKQTRKRSKAKTDLAVGAVQVIRRPVARSTNPTRDLIAASPLFDAEWYAAEFEDVAEAEVDPAYHYLMEGGLEGRPASPAFHSASYLAYNIDVARSGANPLVHYLQSPEAEKRPFDSIEAFTDAFGDQYTDMSPYLAVEVARTELFDAEWFSKAYPDVKKSGLSPVVYYIVHGFTKRLNPGPEFDGGAYLDSNPDVFAANMNPLVHYVLHGQFEDRKKRAVPPPSSAAEKPAKRKTVEWRTGRIDEAAAVAAIAATPLFDASWYSAQYSDASRAGISPALHYYRYGTAENRRPSLYFDPVFYSTQVPELAENSGNPLIHYLYNGRATGLKPIALLSFTPPGRRVVETMIDPIIPAPEQFDLTRPQWKRHEQLALSADEHGLFWGGTLLGKVATGDAAGLDLAPLTAFSHLLNYTTDAALSLGNASSTLTDAVSLPAFRSDSFRGLGSRLRQGPSALADLWFATQNSLRMRFGHPGSELKGDAEPVVIRAFQADLSAPGKLILAGEGVLGQTAPSMIDTQLDNPLAPVILVLSTIDEKLLEFGILPFPSLFRGGDHHAELAAFYERANPVADYCALSDGFVREFCGWNEPAPSPFAISDLLVRLDGAIGGEKIFSPSVREWLLAVFGVALATSSPASEGEEYIARSIAAGEGIRAGLSSRISIRQGGATLGLCGDGLPTLAALVSRRLAPGNRGAARGGSYLIAERVASRPLWQVVVPSAQSDLLDIQPADAPVEVPILSWPDASTGQREASDGNVDALPLAIVYRVKTKPSEATLLAPRAPDASGPILQKNQNETAKSNGSITAVITAGDSAGTTSAIAALAAQTIVSNVDVVLISANGASEAIEDLERLFPDRYQIVTETGDSRRDLAAAAALSKSQFLLLLDSFVIMHDVRTLETLSAMMSNERVASAGCAILRETVGRRGSLVQFQSGGYFPSHVSLLAAPQLIVSEPNILEVLPVSTYAVFGNSFNCALVRADLLASACASEEGTYTGGRFELRFSLAALADGYRHVCTTGVRVTSIAPMIEHEDIDPLGARFIRPSRWEELLSSVTLVRELR